MQSILSLFLQSSSFPILFFPRGIHKWFSWYYNRMFWHCHIHFTDLNITSCLRCLSKWRKLQKTNFKSKKKSGKKWLCYENDRLFGSSWHVILYRSETGSASIQVICTLLRLGEAKRLVTSGAIAEAKLIMLKCCHRTSKKVLRILRIIT